MRVGLWCDSDDERESNGCLPGSVTRGSLFLFVFVTFLWNIKVFQNIRGQILGDGG